MGGLEGRLEGAGEVLLLRADKQRGGGGDKVGQRGLQVNKSPAEVQ